MEEVEEEELTSRKVDPVDFRLFGGEEVEDDNSALEGSSEANELWL